MRKSTIFISSVLTTFTLVVLFGVVKAYQNNALTQTTQVAVQPGATAMPTDIPSAVITPEQAAQLAAQVIGGSPLSAETSSFNGVQAYLITFTNKDMVYVGLDGQILSVQVAPVMVEAVQPVVKVKNNQVQSGDGEGSDD